MFIYTVKVNKCEVVAPTQTPFRIHEIVLFKKNDAKQRFDIKPKNVSSKTVSEYWKGKKQRKSR